jgi:hypothetical protein
VPSTVAVSNCAEEGRARAKVRESAARAFLMGVLGFGNRGRRFWGPYSIPEAARMTAASNRS